MVTFLGAVHYNYGNDYMNYYIRYKGFVQQPFNFTSIMEREVYRDPGWVLLCYVFSHLGGFFMMVAVLNVVQNVIIYRFIKRDVARKWWWLGFYIYVFGTGYYLMSFTMMRQWFVVCIFLGLWNIIKKKKWLTALIILYLCTFIHGTAIVLLPFAFWGYIRSRDTKIVTIVFIIFVITLWIGGTLFDTFFNQVILLTETEEYVEIYSNQVREVHRSLGFALITIPLFVGIYYLFKVENSPARNKPLVLLSLIGFAINPISDIIPMIGRIGLYFSAYRFASIPIIYGSIKNRTIQMSLLFLFLLVIAYDYVIFFPTWKTGFSTFHTIFEVL